VAATRCNRRPCACNTPYIRVYNTLVRTHAILQYLLLFYRGVHNNSSITRARIYHCTQNQLFAQPRWRPCTFSIYTYTCARAPTRILLSCARFGCFQIKAYTHAGSSIHLPYVYIHIYIYGNYYAEMDPRKVRNFRYKYPYTCTRARLCIYVFIKIQTSYSCVRDSRRYL